MSPPVFSMVLPDRNLFRQNRKGSLRAAFCLQNRPHLTILKRSGCGHKCTSAWIYYFSCEPLGSGRRWQASSGSNQALSLESEKIGAASWS
jgi:hypothetical protein